MLVKAVYAMLVPWNCVFKLAWFLWFEELKSRFNLFESLYFFIILLAVKKKLAVPGTWPQIFEVS